MIVDSGIARRSSGPSAERLDNGVFAACGLSWGAGIIHVQATAWHVHEYAPFAALFVLLAASQFAWGIAVYRRPEPRFLRAGIALSLGVVAIWVASRTVGLPVGPERWSPEPVSAADAICTADEAVLALLAWLQLRPRRPTIVRTGAVAVGLLMISLSSLTFMLHGH